MIAEGENERSKTSKNLLEGISIVHSQNKQMSHPIDDDVNLEILLYRWLLRN